MANMRSVHNGGLGFGMVNIPVKMYAAQDSGHGVKFNQCHHHKDGSGHRIQMVRRCTECSSEVAYNDLVKGVERPDGTMLLVTDDELASLDRDLGDGFEILEFVNEDEIDAITFEKPYFLAPDSKAAKTAEQGYVLLRTVLIESGRVGIVRYSTKGVEHNAVLRVYRGKVLVLQNVIWSDELREPDFPVLDKKVDLDPRMLEMAHSIVDSMVGEYDSSKYVDEGTALVKDLIDAKASGEPMTPREEQAAEVEVSDLMAMLEASAAKTASKAKHPAGKRSTPKVRVVEKRTA